MKRILVAGGLCLSLFPGAALAADYQVFAEPQAFSPISVYDWTGLYAGVHGGFGAARGVPAEPNVAGTPTQYPDGWFGGAQIGYNQQLDNGIVLGLEGDISFADISDSVADGGSMTLGSRSDLFGTARVRLGYAMDRFLPYVTGGLIWSHAEAAMTCADGAPDASACSATGPFTVSDEGHSVGWTAGAGLELALADQWTAKLEYLYGDLGDTSLTFDAPEPIGAVTGTAHQTISIVRAGVNFRF